MIMPIEITYPANKIEFDFDPEIVGNMFEPHELKVVGSEPELTGTIKIVLLIQINTQGHSLEWLYKNLEPKVNGLIIMSKNDVDVKIKAEDFIVTLKSSEPEENVTKLAYVYCDLSRMTMEIGIGDFA